MSYRRSKEDKRRMTQIYESKHGWPVGVDYYKGRLYKFYPYSANYNLKKYYCKLTNRRLMRRMKGDYHLSRCQYRKLFDLWWTLF